MAIAEVPRIPPPVLTGDAETDANIVRKHRQAVLDAERKARAAKLELSSAAASVVKVKERSMLYEDVHSKIFKALNPDRLAFQTARDREEAEEEMEVEDLRADEGKFLRAPAPLDAPSEPEQPADNDAEAFGFEDEPQEEVFDPNNIPDFGDMMGELKIKRAERAKAEQARRDELKRQFEEQKRKEAEALAKEMGMINKKKQQEEAAKNINRDAFVKDAQQRLEKELSFGQFVFKW